MATYTIRDPNGRVHKVEGPEGATDEQIIAFVRADQAKRGVKGGQVVLKRPGTGADGKVVQPASYGDLYTEGAAFGLTGEAVGAGGAFVDAIASPFSDKIDFNPVESYRAYRDYNDESLRLAREESPNLSAVAELTGGITSLPTKALAASRSLMDAIKAAPKIAGLQGAVGGFGYGQGLDGSLGGAALGGALGTAVGAALPIAGKVAGGFYNTARDFISPRNGLARQMVAKALADDGITPTMAAEALTAANERGVPAMLADQGANARNLLASVGRKPGPSQRLVREAVEKRQLQQGNRIKGAITRELGPIENTYSVSDRLTAQAKANAAPLYEQAYTAPFTMPESVAALMARPSVQRALGKASRIASEEGRNPQALGFIETEAGKVELPNAPTMQTMDYVKRGLDDVLEGYRDKTTGRLVLNTEGNAVEGTRKQLVSALDQSGEAGDLYRQARAAFGGPAGQKAALARGKNALNLSDEEIEREIANLKPGEIEQYALGARAALSEAIDRRVDNADKVNGLLGSARKRKALAKLFGGEEGFERFMQTMGDEAQTSRTFRSVAGGSETAERLAADQGTSDAGLLQELGGAVVRGGQRGGITGALAEGLSAMRSLPSQGAARTAERTRQEAAALLSEVDPQTLSEAMRKALRDQALRRIRNSLQLQATARAAAIGARGAGGISGYALRPTD